MTTEAKKSGGEFDTLFALLLFVPAHIYGWYVLALCWNELGTPLQWPAVTMAQTAALDMGVSLLRYRYSKKPADVSFTGVVFGYVCFGATVHMLVKLAHWWFA